MSIEEDIGRLEILLAQNSDEFVQAGLIMDFLKNEHSHRNIQAQPYLEILSQLAGKTGSVYLSAWSTYYRSAFSTFAAKYDAARSLSYSAIELFEKIDEKEGLGNAFNNLGVIDEWEGNCVKALENHFASLKIREELGDKYAMAISYNNLGSTYITLANYPEALKSLLTAIEIRTAIGDVGGKGACHLNIGLIYAKTSNYPEALKHYYYALQICESAGNIGEMSNAHNNIGTMHFRIGNFAEALKSHSKALLLAKEIGDKFAIAMSYRNIGVTYQLLGNFTDAMHNHLLALQIREEIGDKSGLSDSHNAIGDVYERKADLPDIIFDDRVQALTQALEYYKKALQIGDKNGDRSGMAHYYISISGIYEKLENYPQSIANLNLAAEIARELKSDHLIKFAAFGLTNCYKAMRDFENALQNYELYHGLEKEVLGEQAQKQLTDLNFQHNLGQKEKEAEIARLKNVELKEAFEKLEQEKLRGELLFENQVQQLKSDALKAQMNPHFVFNSLNSIQQFIWEKEPEEAVSYLTRFSKLIQTVLQNTRSQYVTLEQDIIALEYYIELEALRFENKFEYHIHCDKGLNKSEVQIPPMIIQPFVENAIIHGLQPLKIPGRLNIKLSIKDDNALVITVEDNGVGREQAGQIKIGTGKTHHSVAIQLTKERLQKMGNGVLADNAIVITDLFDMGNKPAGTRVEISVPYKYSP